jgi:glutathione peroxidase
MNQLIDRFPADKFVILAFPCNQFGFQEYGTPTEILNTLKHVRPGNGFIPKATMFRKVEVNGANTHPLYSVS